MEALIVLTEPAAIEIGTEPAGAATITTEIEEC
jgi:hypothetical protein